FQAVAPVNGRLLDADDVVASYKRYQSAPAYQSSFSGMVDSVTAPDRQTVIFKLRKPNAAFLSTLADYHYFWIFPKERDSQYDPAKTPIGTGPWMWSNYVPGNRIEYTRNPDYYESGLPNMEAVQTLIFSDISSLIAKFKAGDIAQYGSYSSFSDFQNLS